MCDRPMKITFKFRAKPTKTEEEWLYAELRPPEAVAELYAPNA